MNATIVLPSIYPPYTDDCLLSLAPELVEQTVVVRNTPEENLGVAGSWNFGADVMRTRGDDWLVILSAAVRFGAPGGRDFMRALEGRLSLGKPNVVEAGRGLGWHLIAFHRSVFARVGLFDEGFWPAYHEDNDMSYRIQLAYGMDSRAPGFVGPLWPKVNVDATLVEVAHGIKHSGVTVDFAGLANRYAEKWGGKSGEETYTTPWGRE